MGGGGRASGRGVQGGSGPHPHIRGAAAGSAGRQLPGRKASLGFARVHSSEVKAIFLLMFPNVETLANDSKNCITWRASPNRSEGQIPASGCRFADLRPRPPRALRGLQGAHPAGNRCKAPPPAPDGPRPPTHSPLWDTDRLRSEASMQEGFLEVWPLSCLLFRRSSWKSWARSSVTLRGPAKPVPSLGASLYYE